MSKGLSLSIYFHKVLKKHLNPLPECLALQCQQNFIFLLNLGTIKTSSPVWEKKGSGERCSHFSCSQGGVAVSNITRQNALPGDLGESRGTVSFTKGKGAAYTSFITSEFTRGGFSSEKLTVLSSDLFSSVFIGLFFFSAFSAMVKSSSNSKASLSSLIHCKPSNTSLTLTSLTLKRNRCTTLCLNTLSQSRGYAFRAKTFNLAKYFLTLSSPCHDFSNVSIFSSILT